jgi:hypothetical protein
METLVRSTIRSSIKDPKDYNLIDNAVESKLTTRTISSLDDTGKGYYKIKYEINLTIEYIFEENYKPFLQKEKTRSVQGVYILQLLEESTYSTVNLVKQEKLNEVTSEALEMFKKIHFAAIMDRIKRNKDLKTPTPLKELEKQLYDVYIKEYDSLSSTQTDICALLSSVTK